MSNTEKMLEIKDLSVIYKTDLETVYAVNDVSFSLEKGATLGLVGETGAGKTTLALTLMRLLPERTGKITSGSITFEGESIVDLPEAHMRKIRGDKIAMIFQDPMTSLNPVLTVGEQIAEALRTVYGARLTAIYDKSSQTLPFKAALGAVDGYLWGTSDHASHIVLENGERFCVNWEKGQKTGFFLDQRENRQLVKRYAKGRTVLNTFCYTGGFSVYALSGGAGEVCSVDSSERAVALATENMQLNFGDNAAHSEVAADAGASSSRSPARRP